MLAMLSIRKSVEVLRKAIVRMFDKSLQMVKGVFAGAMRNAVEGGAMITAFLCVLCMCFSIAANSQTISLSGKEITLKKAISAVEKQTGMLVLANKELLDLAKPVAITSQKMPLKNFLDVVFKDQPLKYVIEGNSVLISRNPDYVVSDVKPIPRAEISIPQQQIVTGVVTDSTGTPLAGATIEVRGKRISTATDENGRFEIPADNGDMLVISYVGFTTREVVVREGRQLSIILMHSGIGLGEVIVIGYGTQRRAVVTGAVESVRGTELAKAPTTHLTTSLAGRMTGVVVNTRTSYPGNESVLINIRGKSTWQGASPLVIVDGIANRSGWERINTDEIESISVLKDASAAIYGSRAANGVILITTKRGNTGKPVLNYRGDVGFTKLSRLTPMTRSWQYAQYFTEAKRPGYIFTPEDIEKFRTNADPNLFPNYELNDYVLANSAPQTTHTLSLTGGSEAVKYFISGRFLNQKSIFKDAVDDFKSYNVRSNIDVNATKNFKLGLNLSLRRDDKVRAAGSYADNGYFEDVLGTDPTRPMYYENGYPASIYDKNLAERIQGKQGEIKDGTFVLNSQLTARWDLPFLVKGLYLEGTGAYDFTSVRTKEFSKSYDFYSYNNATGEYVNLNTEPVLSRYLYDYMYNAHRYTVNARVGYDKVFNRVHNISAFAAYEQFSMNTEWINGTRSSFLSDQIPYLFMGAIDGQKNDGSGSETAYRNYFGRIAYAYDSKYLLDFTLRRDESLTFPPDQRVGWFPGISVGWRLSEEDFIRNNYKMIDNLKLRASYGQMGSDNVGAFQYLASAALRPGTESMVFGPEGAVVPTLYITGTPNPNIHWEVANSYNVAVEGSLWNGKLGFELEYFFSKRSNILARRNASIPLYTGLSLPDENIGKAQNQGFEILLTHANRIGEFKYDVGVNLTHTANKIIYMDESPRTPDYQKREGHPIDSWLVYLTDGIFNTKDKFDNTPVKRAGAQLGDLVYVNVDGDNSISDNDRVRLYSSSLPKYTFGIPMNFEYKNFDLSLLWQGQAGVKTYVNPTTRNGDINIPMWLYENRWTPETAGTATMPRAFYHRSESYNTISSDFWLRDASFLRLKTAQLGYTLPKRISEKASMSLVRFYVSGFNLLLFDKMKDYDPEVVNSLGVFYPSTKVFNIGLMVTF